MCNLHMTYESLHTIAHNSDFPYVKCNYIGHIERACYVHSNCKQ